MQSFLLRWFFNAIAIYVTTLIIRGIQVPDFAAALVAALVLGIVNAFIRPIVTLLTLPLSCATFGLFAFVVNAVMFWLVGWLSGAFTVSVPGALLGSIVMGIVSGVANHLIVSPRES